MRFDHFMAIWIELPFLNNLVNLREDEFNLSRFVRLFLASPTNSRHQSSSLTKNYSSPLQQQLDSPSNNNNHNNCETVSVQSSHFHSVLICPCLLVVISHTHT